MMHNFRYESVAAIILLSTCFLLATVSTVNGSNVWDGDLEAPAEILEVNYEKEYERINEYLEESVKEDHIEPNMKKANELFNELLSASTFSLQRRKMIKALELFLSMGALENKAKCNMESYRILVQNDRSVNGVAHQMIGESETQQLNRVQKIIHDATVRHAESCYNRYPDLFKEIYYKMDRTMVDKVAQLLDGFIHSQKALGRESDSKKIYNRFVFQPEAMGAWNFAKAIYDNMSDLPLHTPSSSRVLSLIKKKGIHKKKTKYLIKERVLEPCGYFFRQLKDVFIPARFDAVFHREDDDDDFYLSWARFRLCNGILHLDRRQLIKQIDAIYKENTAEED